MCLFSNVEFICSAMWPTVNWLRGEEIQCVRSTTCSQSKRGPVAARSSIQTQTSPIDTVTYNGEDNITF